MNKLRRSLLGTANTKYQSSTHYVFRQEDFMLFLNYVTPWTLPFKSQRCNLNTFGRGPLDDATYQT